MQITDPLAASLYPGYDKLGFTPGEPLLAGDRDYYLNMGADNQQAICLKSPVFLLSIFIFMGLCRCTSDSELSFCRK